MIDDIFLLQDLSSSDLNYSFDFKMLVTPAGKETPKHSTHRFIFPPTAASTPTCTTSQNFFRPGDDTIAVSTNKEQLRSPTRNPVDTEMKCQPNHQKTLPTFIKYKHTYPSASLSQPDFKKTSSSLGFNTTDSSPVCSSDVVDLSVRPSMSVNQLDFLKGNPTAPNIPTTPTIKLEIEPTCTSTSPIKHDFEPSILIKSECQSPSPVKLESQPHDTSCVPFPVKTELPSSEQEDCKPEIPASDDSNEDTTIHPNSVSPPQEQDTASHTQSTSPDKAPASVTSHQKPKGTFAMLIGEALMSVPGRSMSVKDIYSYLLVAYPFFQNANSSWRSSVRHCLTANSCFSRTQPGIWTLNPVAAEQFSQGNFEKKVRAKRCQKRTLAASVKRIAPAPSKVTANQPQAMPVPAMPAMFQPGVSQCGALSYPQHGSVYPQYAYHQTPGYQFVPYLNPVAIPLAYFNAMHSTIKEEP